MRAITCSLPQKSAGRDMEEANSSTDPEANCFSDSVEQENRSSEGAGFHHRTTIKFRMSPEELRAGIVSLSPEMRKRFVADLIAGAPAWGPYIEDIDLEVPGSGTIYGCESCGFETEPHDD